MKRHQHTQQQHKAVSIKTITQQSNHLVGGSIYHNHLIIIIIIIIIIIMPWPWEPVTISLEGYRSIQLS
jgi:hypothetical protein